MYPNTPPQATPPGSDPQPPLSPQPTPASNYYYPSPEVAGPQAINQPPLPQQQTASTPPPYQAPVVPASPPAYQPPHWQTAAPQGDMASIDYLEQIAAPQKRTFAWSRKMIFIVAGVLVAMLLAVVFMTLANARPNISQLSQTLVNQTASTAEIAKLASKQLKSSELLSLNGTLQSQMTSATSTIPAALTQARVTVKVPDTGNKTLALADGQKVADNLEEARLLSTYDRVYVREMTYRVSQIMTQLDSIYNRTNSESLKTQLKATYDSLVPIRQQLEEFGTSAT